MSIPDEYHPKLVMNEYAEFVDTEPIRPWERTVPPRNHPRRPSVPQTYPERPCAICGTRFSPGSSSGKYCSDECRKKAQDERNARRFT